jgi:hypothetical protein
MTATVDETLLLVARSVCEPCGGEGQRVNDDWTSFEEWRSRRPVARPDDEDDLVEQYFLVVCDYASVPPMREPCDDCDGTGRVDAEVSVADLLEAVYEHVDRPIVKTAELDEIVDRVKKAITSAALSSEGLADGMELGTWLRAVQEGAEALRSIAALRPHRNGGM